jgi:hypothetical protein
MVADVVTTHRATAEAAATVHRAAEATPRLRLLRITAVVAVIAVVDTAAAVVVVTPAVVADIPAAAVVVDILVADITRKQLARRNAVRTWTAFSFAEVASESLKVL